MTSSVTNDMIVDEFGVLRLAGHEAFSYSDGRKSEIRLQACIDGAADISTNSVELEQLSYDWVSEYHLSRKRAQLLSGFSFEREISVLEVGCGCGAITRFLGENFAKVTSVEGNVHRARIARSRTRDLSNVSIICAPFQELDFKEKFDLIICVGVYEYSGFFIESSDPYREALRYFADSLNDNGHLLIAIENQFGLKYFAGVREDHVGKAYEGISGYPNDPDGVRTFGKDEISQNLSAHFESVQFFYPFPDYKLPTAVFSESFVKRPESGELLSRIPSRDYFGDRKRRFDEAKVTYELAKNRSMDFFSNSFIVVAAKQKISLVEFNQEAIVFSDGRHPNFETISRFVEKSGQLTVHKAARYPASAADGTDVYFVPNNSSWKAGLSLEGQISRRLTNKKLSVAEIFSPARQWYGYLLDQSVNAEGRAMLPGDLIDATWGNTFVSDSAVEIIDREFKWSSPVSLQILLIRTIYHFILKHQTELALHAKLQKYKSGKKLIDSIADSLGCHLDKRDYENFISTETRFQNAIFNIENGRMARHIRWFLVNRPSLQSAIFARNFIRRVYASLKARLGGL
jgi:SAM-dependent methyltransferase